MSLLGTSSPPGTETTPAAVHTSRQGAAASGLAANAFSAGASAASKIAQSAMQSAGRRTGRIMGGGSQPDR